MIKSLRAAIALGAIALIAALPTSPKAQELKIGAVLPLSGANADYGDLYMTGTELAVEHITADGLLKGKLSIQYEDSQALPQQGVIAMNKLVNVEKTPYVLSAFTGVSKAISPIAQR